MKRIVALAAAAGLAWLAAAPAKAEVKEIKAAQQYGLSSLPLMIMEDGKLVERHAKALGLGDLTVTWVKLGNPGAITEGLVSGSLDFGSGDAEYKRRLSSEVVDEADVFLFAPGLKGAYLRLMRLATVGLHSAGRKLLERYGLVDWVKTRWRRRMAPAAAAEPARASNSSASDD